MKRAARHDPGGSTDRERAMTTFCWLPPERLLTGAASDAARIWNRRTIARTASSSDRFGTHPSDAASRDRRRRPAFSRTDIEAKSPSPWRSAGT
jgi:hypothetical protein